MHPEADVPRPRKMREEQGMSICIECALQNHEFLEVPVPARGANGSSQASSPPHALIDGREHDLNYVRLYHIPCDDCRRVSGALFVAKED